MKTVYSGLARYIGETTKYLNNNHVYKLTIKRSFFSEVFRVEYKGSTEGTTVYSNFDNVKNHWSFINDTFL